MLVVKGQFIFIIFPLFVPLQSNKLFVESGGVCLVTMNKAFFLKWKEHRRFPQLYILLLFDMHTNEWHHHFVSLSFRMVQCVIVLLYRQSERQSVLRFQLARTKLPVSIYYLLVVASQWLSNTNGAALRKRKKTKKNSHREEIYDGWNQK